MIAPARGPLGANPSAKRARPIVSREIGYVWRAPENA
ncbi:hypothetical protein SAMN05216368_10981 [Cryobacterium flavum]|uniref:Uncharacterized protein n=1 Tax=Cryobacterium flavum TaxID=1424659 RepID=A0A5E9G0V0_9MICO|nr:hypothetical protein SAMN05216368_10981 [Cryobacterium flavum]